MPKISIVIPIYNQEKFLRKCLDSIEQQTFRDFEVILVDDGSKDASADICKEYVQRDNRFVYFYKDNGGVSSARQYGHDHVSGEYTIHCDPDDWVEPDWLEALYTEAIRTNADMTICDFRKDYPNSYTLYIQQPSALTVEQAYIDIFEKLQGSCWNKLVKTSRYKDNNVQFPVKVDFCEDKIFILKLLKYCHKIAYVNQMLYHYCANEGSLVSRITRKGLADRLNAHEILCCIVPTSFRQLFETEFHSSILWSAWFCDELSPQEFKRFSKPYRGDILKSRKMSRMRKLVLLLGSYGPTATVKKLHNLYLSRL